VAPGWVGGKVAASVVGWLVADKVGVLVAPPPQAAAIKATSASSASE